jgi:hypothetical protein
VRIVDRSVAPAKFIHMLKEFSVPSVETRSDVTPEIFAREILPAAQPVLLKGLVASWPAVSQGQTSPDAVAAYLKAMDSRRPASVLEAGSAIKGRFAYGPDMHDFNFNRRTRSISEGLDQLLGLLEHPNPPYVYIQSTPVAQYLPRFLTENVNPLLPPFVLPNIWISNQTRAQTHNDNDHNIACVVAGRRRFTLFPPEQVSNLYIGPLEHTPSGRAISLASLEEPDFDTYPRLREAISHARIAEMEPGDALFVPRYWWHHVQSLERFNVLINYWWGTSPNPLENPVTCFNVALLALKDLPDAERAYWKRMFDDYIFRTNGDALAHIPVKHQGGLGRHTLEIRNGLIRALQQIFRG